MGTTCAAKAGWYRVSGDYPFRWSRTSGVFPDIGREKCLSYACNYNQGRLSVLQTIWVAGNEIDKECVIGFGPVHTVLGLIEFTLWTKYGPINIRQHEDAEPGSFIRERDTAIISWRKGQKGEAQTSADHNRLIGNESRVRAVKKRKLNQSAIDTHRLSDKVAER